MARQRLTEQERAAKAAEAKARYEAFIKAAVDAAPPLSSEQVARLRALLGVDRKEIRP